MDDTTSATTIRIRRLGRGPADRARVAELQSHCSAYDLKMRFGYPRARPENVDWSLPRGRRDVASLILVDGTPCGTFCCRAGRHGYELAGIVAEPWQRRGLGRAGLLWTLARLPHGAVVMGQIDAVNVAARRLLQRCVAGVAFDFDSETVSFEFSRISAREGCCKPVVLH
ncbi:GNAT family N-acetyltransferase [Mycolicibacterium palauense]|uniref:GNAT family N-acetyltransferase n=1 Tax=Mycolicibacterium palauense TaxID=2034511 RepID=UPI000BFED793|nr:GNAT family N-acetyltransferase [Mycolicibacterium palauense]